MTACTPSDPDDPAYGLTPEEIAAEQKRARLTLGTGDLEVWSPSLTGAPCAPTGPRPPRSPATAPSPAQHRAVADSALTPRDGHRVFHATGRGPPRHHPTGSTPMSPPTTTTTIRPARPTEPQPHPGAAIDLETTVEPVGPGRV